MKRGAVKRFLARTLAIAVAATSVLYGGGLSAEAAPRVRRESVNEWMHTSSNNKFSMNPNNWLDLTAKQPFSEFGRNYTVGPALAIWYLESSPTEDGNNNTIGYTNAAAPACVYASKVNIASQDDSKRVMRFALYPTGNMVDANGIRLGIMLKYVDDTHYVYLGYNGKYWYIEWKNGSDTGYVQSEKDPTNPSHQNKYTNAEGQEVTGWGAFQSLKMAKDQYFRITISYEDAGHIRIRIAPCDVDQEKDEVGNVVLTEKKDAEGNSLAIEDLLSFKVFKDLRDYANQKDSTGAKIYLGFAAGTDQNAGATAALKTTKMNIVNVMEGALKSDANITSLDPVSVKDEAWAEPLELINYGDCGWTSPKNKDPETILQPRLLKTGDDPAFLYATLGKLPKKGASNDDLNVSVYNKSVSDFSEGSVSGVLRLNSIGAGKEYSIGVMTDQAPQAKSIKVGISNDKWVYSVNGGAAVEPNQAGLPEIKANTDYNITVNIDKAGKVTASASGGNVEGTLIGEGDNVTVSGLSGNVFLSAKGDVLRVRDVVCNQTKYGKSALEAKYDELSTANDNYSIYTDEWAKFSELTEAKAKLDQNNDDMSESDSAYTPFNAAAAAALEAAYNTKINTTANQVATGKRDLEAAVRAIKAIVDAQDASELYTATSLATVNSAMIAAESLIESIGSEDFAGITKAEVTQAIAAIGEDQLVKNPAGSEDIAKLKNLLDEKIDGIDLENDGKYYGSAGWEALTDAIETIQRLTADDANPTLADVRAATAALNNVNLVLKNATSSELESFSGSVASIKAAVGAKKYVDDANWKNYVAILGEAEKLAAGTNPKLMDLDRTLADLQASVTKLTEDTSSPTPPPITQTTDPKPGERKVVGNETYVIGTAPGTVELVIGDINQATANIGTAPVMIDGKPYTVTAIQANAYKGSKKLKKVQIGDSIVSIGKSAFASCQKLTSVTFGKAVTTIDGAAFSKCKKLKTVTFKGTAVKTIKKKSFNGSKVKKVKVPKSLKKNKAFLKKVQRAGMKVKKLS